MPRSNDEGNMTYRKLLCVASVWAGLVSPQALAIEGSTSQALKQEFEQTFTQMLKEPGNVDIAMRYSQLAEQLGDYEAAIPPLERLLMFNPDLPDIKLKLGVLYHKLGSDDVAKTYFNDAMQGDKVPERTVSEAKRYLKQL